MYTHLLAFTGESSFQGFGGAKLISSCHRTQEKEKPKLKEHSALGLGEWNAFHAGVEMGDAAEESQQLPKGTRNKMLTVWGHDET